jgi:hypothetical protein
MAGHKHQSYCHLNSLFFSPIPCSPQSFPCFGTMGIVEMWLWYNGFLASEAAFQPEYCDFA